MQQVIVAVRDTAIDAYNSPFVTAAAGAAVRAFRNEVNNRDSDLHRNATDYELWQLATFDPETGDIHMDRQRLARAIDLKEQQQ